MSKTINLSEGRQELLNLPNYLNNEPLIITENGQPLLVAFSYEQYVSLLETLEILEDEKFCTQLNESIKQDQKGETISWEDAKKQLGW